MGVDQYKDGATARMRSFVFAVPILLVGSLLLVTVPNTWREAQLWSFGTQTTAFVRRAGADIAYLDYSANGRPYTTGGQQKAGSRLSTLQDGASVAVIYVPDDPQIVTLDDPGPDLLTSLLVDVTSIIVSFLWIKGAWSKWLGWPSRARTTTSTSRPS
jgi:hypothetical protein